MILGSISLFLYTWSTRLESGFLMRDTDHILNYWFWLEMLDSHTNYTLLSERTKKGKGSVNDDLIMITICVFLVVLKLIKNWEIFTHQEFQFEYFILNRNSGYECNVQYSHNSYLTEGSYKVRMVWIIENQISVSAFYFSMTSKCL